MKVSWLLALLLLAFNVNAETLEARVLKELPKIAALYADGYARLDKKSLKVKLLYKDKEGECTLISSFKMEGFSHGPNFTQFIGFFNCPTFHQLVTPNRKIFLSDLYRFYIGEPELDISTTQIEGNLIKLKGLSRKTQRPVEATFEPSGGPGWWRLKQVKGMAAHEILSGM
ncbi:MAG: hypothetical protein OEY52_11770 [Gammaproteobacteria bacterium]|nr:hypothetical protein [Gammaproteobacteria bacterium]